MRPRSFPQLLLQSFVCCPGWTDTKKTGREQLGRAIRDAFCLPVLISFIMNMCTCVHIKLWIFGGKQTQDLTHSRQTLYHWAPSLLSILWFFWLCFHFLLSFLSFPLFYTWEWIAYMYACVPHVCLEARKGHQIT